MKNKIKSILIILITIAICLSVGVYAGYILSATEVTYTKSDGTTVSVKEALDELYTIQPLTKAVSVGDYVAYDATNNYSYKSPTGTGSSHGNGYGDQTFTSSSSIKWRVLGWDETTGGVILISESPKKTDAGKNFYIRGGIGYLYAEQELNNICAIYGHGTGANTSKTFKYLTGDVIEGTTTGTITGSGARSINVDDINKICNVIPSKDLASDYGKAPYTKSIYYPTTSQSTGKSTSAASRTDVHTYYSYTGSNYLTSTEEPYKMLFKDTTNSSGRSYWMASRCVNSYSSYSHFRVRFVSDGCEYGRTLGGGYGRNFDEYSDGYSVRPVVYLKSSIQTNGKNSSGAWTIIDK